MKLVRYSLLLALLFCISQTTFSQTSIEGNITDAETSEVISFATVALYKNGVLTTGTETDLNGKYYITNLEPGTYDIEASFLGYTSQRQTNVVIKAGKVNRLDFVMDEGGVLVDEIVITEYKAPLIDPDNTTSGGIVTSEKIRSLPTKNINQLASTVAGLSSIDGGAINVRGSRSNATNYYIDGMRVFGLIPESEIEQLEVLTGGLPAQYGDVTGGVISITTKGPSSIYSGGVEMETSQYLDAFGYNQLRGNASGPILKNSEGESILGFRVSGQFQYRKDDFPSALGAYRAPLSIIQSYEEDPFQTLGGTQFPSGEFLSDSDIGGVMKARPNEDQTDLDFTAKLDYRLNQNINVQLSGSFDNTKDRFTPSTGWGLLNWNNNPYSYNNGYRANFRWRHKLGQQSNFKNSDKKAHTSLFQNFSYSLQGGYEKRHSRTEDIRHEDDLFRYGYLGSTERTWDPVVDLLSDTAAWNGQIVFDGIGRPFAHVGYLEQVEQFEANQDINGVLSKYNQLNGSLISPLNVLWSGLYSNVGQVYNSFSKAETDRYTFQLEGGFDIVPESSNLGRHSIQFGAIYENRIERGYSISPRGLWQLAQLNANRHIIGIDTDNVIGTFDFPILGGTATFDQYQTLINDDSNLLFFRKIRELTGQSINEYVNVDAINPDNLSLDMFSAAELNDFGIINYYGYDHLGNKIGTDLNFSDFFSGSDGERRNFLVAPNNPVYGAIFIQDKFSIEDLIVRVGLRVDYYDANTKVLKDPYSLYEIENASEFFARNTDQIRPAAVGDDYKVYIESPDSETVVGYRQGDNWFLPNGTSVTDGSEIFGGGVVTPALKGAADGRIPNIQNPDFDPNTSFTDYKPQINFMPRIAFSFPISKDAGFFAHYDVLVQRPPSNTIASGLNYFYFADPSRTPVNNPNLKPEKTIDYEVGFQQKLSNSSAIKVSAYYKELRDMIQLRFLSNTYPVTRYQIFDNLDFGTVKGFSFNYDLRRTNNLELSANYTLQFADGSGSSATSSAGINSRGALRTLNPLTFDERHRLNAVIDYRYGRGKAYNGPRIADKDIFANAGVNFQVTTVSGRPYTRNRTVEPLGGSGFIGGINEARLPWTFAVDMRADKSFQFGGREGARPYYLNVYLRVQNLLNSKNVIDVYPFTGDPNDDGYLLSTFGEDRMDQVEDNGQSVENFVDAYTWRLLNQSHFTLPRRIYLGAIFEF